MRKSKNEAAAELGRRTLVRKLKSRLNKHLQLNPGVSDEDSAPSELRRQLEQCRNAVNAEFLKVTGGDELERLLKIQRQETVDLQKQEVTPHNLPGRDVLKKIAELATPRGSYEALRNAIVNEMAREGYQPPAMKAVLDRCLSSANST